MRLPSSVIRLKNSASTTQLSGTQALQRVDVALAELVEHNSCQGMGVMALSVWSPLDHTTSTMRRMQASAYELDPKEILPLQHEKDGIDNNKRRATKDPIQTNTGT